MKALGLLAASAVLWGIGGAVMGGGMLTSDPAVREWVGRASFWHTLALLLTPALLDRLQSRWRLGAGARFGTAFVFMAFPLLLCLSMRSGVPDASRFIAPWLTMGLVVSVVLSVIAAALSKPSAVQA